VAKAVQVQYWWGFFVNWAHVVQALPDLIGRRGLPSAAQAQRSMENQLSLDPVVTAEL